MIGRRGFLGTLAALVAAPLLPEALSEAGIAAAGPPEWQSLSVAVPMLTERAFADYLGVPMPPFANVRITDIRDEDLAE